MSHSANAMMVWKLFHIFARFIALLSGKCYANHLKCYEWHPKRTLACTFNVLCRGWTPASAECAWACPVAGSEVLGWPCSRRSRQSSPTLCECKGEGHNDDWFALIFKQQPLNSLTLHDLITSDISSTEHLMCIWVCNQLNMIVELVYSCLECFCG